MRISLSLVVVAVLGAPVRADDQVQLMVDAVHTASPDTAVDQTAVSNAIGSTDVTAVLASCTHDPKIRVLGWVVFDGGKPATVDAAGSGDKKIDACVIRALRNARLGSKARVAASVTLAAHVTTSVGGNGTGTVNSGGGGGGVVAKGAIDTSQPVTTLSPERAHKVIKAHARELRGCYEARLKDDPKLAGKVNLTFTVGTDGKVTSASASPHLDLPLESCLVGKLKSFVFPASMGPTTINYPIVFDAAN